jgi:predicted ABC-type ATPase
VFSYRSKLDLVRTARAGGYTVVLHVLLVPEDLAVERVRHRVQAGGHVVPEIKVRGRYRRVWALVADAMALSDNATVYDNSRLRGPRIVTQLSGGDVVGAPTWPACTPESLRSRWPN